MTDDIHEQFRQHAHDDERHFGELQAALTRIESKLDPILDAYNGVLFSKKFIVGISSVVIAVGAIGAGVIWIINHALHK